MSIVLPDIEPFGLIMIALDAAFLPQKTRCLRVKNKKCEKVKKARRVPSLFQFSISTN